MIGFAGCGARLGGVGPLEGSRKSTRRSRMQDRLARSRKAQMPGRRRHEFDSELVDGIYGMRLVWSCPRTIEHSSGFTGPEWLGL